MYVLYSTEETLSYQNQESKECHHYSTKICLHHQLSVHELEIGQASHQEEFVPVSESTSHHYLQSDCFNTTESGYQAHIVI